MSSSTRSSCLSSPTCSRVSEGDGVYASVHVSVGGCVGGCACGCVGGCAWKSVWGGGGSVYMLYFQTDHLVSR